MHVSRVRPAPALFVHLASSWPASRARAPKLLMPEVLSHLDTCAPVTMLCFFLLFALRDSAQLMPQPLLTRDPSSLTLTGGGLSSPCSQGHTPRPAITPGSSPPGMSPSRVHLPSHSTPRGSLPTQWSWITLRKVGWGAGLCCPPLSGPVGVLFIQSHPGTRDLWRRAQSARKVGHYANARERYNSH